MTTVGGAEVVEVAGVARVVGVKRAAVAAGNKGGDDVRGSTEAALDSDSDERQPGRTCCGAHTHTRDTRVYIWRAKLCVYVCVEFAQMYECHRVLYV